MTRSHCGSDHGQRATCMDSDRCQECFSSAGTAVSCPLMRWLQPVLIRPKCSFQLFLHTLTLSAQTKFPQAINRCQECFSSAGTAVTFPSGRLQSRKVWAAPSKSSVKIATLRRNPTRPRDLCTDSSSSSEVQPNACHIVLPGLCQVY